MMKRVLTGGLMCVLVVATGASGAMMDAPVMFSGPGNSLTASGTLVGSATLSGSGGMYTYDDANNVWVAETFTIAEQTVSLQAAPALLSLSSSPTGSMTVRLDDGTYAVDSFFDISFDLANGGLEFDLAPVSLAVDLDAGGSTTIDLLAAGAFSPLDWTAIDQVTTGVNVDVVAAAGPIPLGYLFNAAYEEAQTNAAAVSSLTIDPGVGAWYEFGAEFSADFEDITLNFTDAGTLEMNTFSGSQYPYYALTLDYDVSGCAGLCDVHGDFGGVGEIPEPTTVSLVLLGPAVLRLRRRR